MSCAWSHGPKSDAPSLDGVWNTTTTRAPPGHPVLHSRRTKHAMQHQGEAERSAHVTEATWTRFSHGEHVPLTESAELIHGSTHGLRHGHASVEFEMLEVH